MMKTLTTILILALAYSVFGNDGVYLSSGSLIYPTKETKIRLDKEILSFTIRDDRAYVDIQFEFYNPESSDRKLLIGFQAPTSTGDVLDSISNTNLIENFTISQDGSILPYELKVAECEDCHLKEFGEIQFSQFNQGIFVYLFEINFKPGINQINHSYNFPASSSFMMSESYDYILTTGAKWAGGKIGDLTVQIDLGQNKYFCVNDIFGKNADWSIIGTGKVTNELKDYFRDSSKMVRIINGKLQINTRDFQPTKNIVFGIPREFDFEISDYDISDLNEGISKKDLRIMRNKIYALYGYEFKSPDLKDYFNQFEWYIPNPNIKMNDIDLSEKEQEYIQKIRSKEKE